MLTDAIRVKLRLPGLMVLDGQQLSDRIEIVARYETKEARCPRCQKLTWRVHQGLRQRKRDA